MKYHLILIRREDAGTAEAAIYHDEAAIGEIAH
jgi:hypothetical protein